LSIPLLSFNILKMNNEKKLDLLIEEYKITTERIESFIKNHRDFYFHGLTIVFGILALFKDFKEIFLILPLIVILYISIFMYNYQRTLTNQEYRIYLENKINDLMGEKLIFYSELAYKKIEKKNRLAKFNGLASLFLLILSCIGAFEYVCELQIFNVYFIGSIFILNLVFLLFLIVGIYNIFKVTDNIRKKSIPEILNH
jgi:hypothetical protein